MSNFFMKFAFYVVTMPKFLWNGQFIDFIKKVGCWEPKDQKGTFRFLNFKI